MSRALTFSANIIEREWRRIELVPMDPHCSDIAVALYRRGSVGRVHTYSGRRGAAERVAFLARALVDVGGLEPAEDGYVRFACGDWHALASKRLFLEVAKLESGAELAPRPLAIHDKKSDSEIRVEPQGSGAYRVVGDPSRAAVVAAGLAKLAELSIDDDDPTVVRFPCAHEHDAVVGLLLQRALNVRVVLREEEAVASRGVLAAPSAQENA